MRALIAGLGLIGGSIGKALVARGWNITYVDPHVELRDALAHKAAHARAEWIDGGYDLIILATPVGDAIEQAERLPTGTPATSVCSVMKALVDAALTDDFIAGHPMAGSHEHGLESSNIDLFRNKTWFVARQHPLVEQMIRDCGAKMRVVDPREHDEMVAATSHLPQLLSTALAAYLHDLNPDLEFAGSGLRDFLRLANSHPSVWSPVLAANQGAIRRHLEGMLHGIHRVAEGDRQRFWDALDFVDKLREG
jgi:prephenate dehydrogenase